MCCEHLVCASCAQSVADGRCSVCRATRDRMHRQGNTLPVSTMVVLAALVALAALVSFHLAG